MRSSIFRLSLSLAILLTASVLQAQQTGNTAQQGESLQAQGIEAQQATGGSITGSERFLRENQDVGQIVGGGTEGVGNIRGSAEAATGGQAGRAGTSQLGRGRNNLNNLMNQFNQNMGRQTTRQLSRIPFEIGFEAPPAAPSGEVTLRIQNRLTRIAQARKMGQVSLAMEGQVAVIRGQVANESDRDLVARMVLLEPGISDVRNEIAIPTASTPPTAPAPPAPAPVAPAPLQPTP